MMKKNYKSFSELMDDHPQFRAKDKNGLKVIFRITSSWNHQYDRDYNWTIIGACLNAYKNTGGVSLRISLLGFNLNLSIQTKRP